MRAASDTDGRPAYRPSSLDTVLEDVVTPTGPYRLRLMARSGTWQGSLPGNRVATASQRPDGRVVVRAPDDEALATRPLHARARRRHRRLPRALRPRPAARPVRAVLRRLPAAPPRDRDARRRPRDVRPADRGATRARAIERAIAAPAARRSSRSAALRRLAPVELRRYGLAQQRATTLARLAATLDLERLAAYPADARRRPARARARHRPVVGRA